MIECIDHIVLNTVNFSEAREHLRRTGCPVAWDGLWEKSNLLLFGISVGPINIEVMDAPPQGRDGSVRLVAFDPGDIEGTVEELREAGLNPTDPTEENRMAHHFFEGKSVEAIWRMAGLGTSVPGISSFLCQYIFPPHFGQASFDSLIQFVSLEVGVQEPEAAAKVYRTIFGVQPTLNEAGYLIPLADTPIHLVKGNGVSLLLEARSPDLDLHTLSDAFPAIKWRNVKL